MTNNRRKQELLRYSSNCHWCGKLLSRSTGTVDHVIPTIDGGSNDKSNTVLACNMCNEARSAISCIVHKSSEIKSKLMLKAVIKHLNNHPRDVVIGANRSTILAHVKRMKQRARSLDRDQQLTAAQQRVAELERRNDDTLRHTAKALMDWQAEKDKLTADNARLRELLQTYKHRLDKRWREGTRVDSYARGYQDGLEAAEVIFDDVFKAAIGEGE